MDETFYRFRGYKAPKTPIQRERPRHILVSELLARGFTPKEVAALTGYSQLRIYFLQQQPWIQQRIVMRIEKSVESALKEFLDREVVRSLEVVKEIRDNPEVRAADRLAAAQAILDRRFGRPSQPIVSIEKPVEKMSAEELEQEVRRLAGACGQHDPSGLADLENESTGPTDTPGPGNS